MRLHVHNADATSCAWRAGSYIPNLELFRADDSPSPPRSSSDLEQAKSLVQAIGGGAQTKLELLNHTPDVELQVFRLGSVYPELYSVWFSSGIVYPGSYQQALLLGLTRRRLLVFKVVPASAASQTGATQQRTGRGGHY
jgi:hypothetical protein